MKRYVPFSLLLCFLCVVIRVGAGCSVPIPLMEQVKTPVFAPNGGTFTDATDVTITCETADAKVYYTTDGSDPDESSTLYGDPFTIVGTTTIKVRAYKDGMSPSEIATASFTYTAPVADEEFGLGDEPLTDEEFQSIPLAALPEEATDMEIAEDESDESARTSKSRLRLPARVNLTSRMPPVRSQGRQASCVAWSTGYALKGFQERRERSWSVNTTSHQFSPAFIYNYAKGHDSCRKGMRIPKALNFLRKYGCATWQNMPYDASRCSFKTTQAAIDQAKSFRIAKYWRVNPKDLYEVFLQLYYGRPVIISFRVYENFRTLDGGLIYKKATGKYSGSHAMVVVGYDNRKPYKAIKIMNSWGTGWGGKGYFWISYSAFKKLVRAAYVTRDVISNKRSVNASSQNGGRATYARSKSAQKTINRAKVSDGNRAMISDENRAMATDDDVPEPLASDDASVEDTSDDGYEDGETVTFRAIPAPGMQFYGWQGDYTGTENPLTITVDGDMEIRAVFISVGQKTTKALFDNSNIYPVTGNPTTATQFAIDKPQHVTRIVDYHWNAGQGATPGTIGLTDENGTTYGPWPTIGLDGPNGVVNAYWECSPNIDLPEGTYTVVDSEPSTWSNNEGSDNAGFSRVESTPTYDSSGALFDNGNTYPVDNAPNNPTTFKLTETYTVTLLRTYHWNDGQGATPGTISLTDTNGTTYGPWQTTGATGQDETANAYWECSPNVVLPPGTYTVVDSDPPTWSHNADSNRSGIARVEGTLAPQSQVLFDNGNVFAVFNHPMDPTEFTIDQPHKITLIRNYHWNNGQGATPGTISLESTTGGSVYGPWQTTGLGGQGGVTNAYWQCAPDIVLPAGTYIVVDSEATTWSQNTESANRGMTHIEGIPQ